MIDIRFLTFISLCETRNYTKTAELLYVTQPTVTHHIKSIEKTYDIKLFTSNTKNFQLTPQGELLYKYAIQLQAFDAQFERMLNASEKGKTQLSFSVTPSVNNGYLKYILSQWTAKRSDILYNMSVNDSKRIYDELRVGLIDFAITDSVVSKKSYNCISLLKTNLILVVNKKHHLANIKNISFDDLVDERLVLDVSGSSKREFLDNGLKIKNRSSKDLSNVIEISCPKTTIEMVLNSNVAAIFYESEVENEIKSGKLIPINIIELNNIIEFCLIYNKTHLSGALIEEIASEFQKIYKELNYLKYSTS